MKHIKGKSGLWGRHILFLLVCMLFGCGLIISRPQKTQAKALDEIQKEQIYIHTEEDGSLTIRYHIEWKVLDSSSEGPLTWVKIGIPNAYVEELTALGSSIDRIRYYGSGGDYVRLDLDREYEAGEVVEMDFSIHQHRMYEEEGDTYQFSFTPGWFDDIEVKRLEISWDRDKDTDSDMGYKAEEKKYYSVFTDLAPGEKVQVNVVYPRERYTFSDDYEKKAGSTRKGVLRTGLTIGGMIGPLVYVFYILMKKDKKKWKNDYSKNKGFGCVYTGTGSRGHRTGGGCACACACACAGGGRAGCSRKDFYFAVRKGEKKQNGTAAD